MSGLLNKTKATAGDTAHSSIVVAIGALIVYGIFHLWSKRKA